MKRWHISRREEVDTPSKIEEFIKEIHTVCEKYGLTIDHEDNGQFIIRPLEDTGYDRLGPLSHAMIDE